MSTHHPDVEYEVAEFVGKSGTTKRVFPTFDQAAAFAFSVAASRGETTLDVLIWSEEGARAYGGDDAVRRYNEDPEASVFERFEIKINAAGRVS